MNVTPTDASQLASTADAQSKRENKPVVVISLVVLVVFAILAVFAVFVWPTRYRYDHT
jgi:flagellar basal body-associated protein FliL